MVKKGQALLLLTEAMQDSTLNSDLHWMQWDPEQST